ncbi:hypothetical protein EG329_008840 [Mollisiaceae sp. DMI_Dod_QoI]|nr:hypothetical protein EG329_008840 [Helotiales sp. DMI_Dod_QoI]
MSQDSDSDPELDLAVLHTFVNHILSLISTSNMSSSSPTSPIPSPNSPLSPQTAYVQQAAREMQIPQAPEPARPTTKASELHHCGQFTLYFPRCGHATSHPFHLNVWSGLVCNKNCVYERIFDYWFYADEGSLCSHCGLGARCGLGTLQTMPEEADGEGHRREAFFEHLISSGKLGGTGREEYESYHLRAVAQYNMLIEGITRPKVTVLSPAQARTERGKRLLDRWDIRRMRARRRTEEWVNKIRAEQYVSTKRHVEVGKRPYIVAPTGNPYMDLYTEIPLPALPVPIDNCAWCQFSLCCSDAIKESGPPNALPCGHTFHYNCIVDLFEKRTRAEEKDRCKCPLCNVWFRDVREIPDFYGRYRTKEHIFDSSCGSSVLSRSEEGDLRGHREPPWLEEPSVRDSEDAREEEVEDSTETRKSSSVADQVELNAVISRQELSSTVEQFEQAQQETRVTAEAPRNSPVSDRTAPRRDSGYESGAALVPETQDSLRVDYNVADRIDSFEDDQLSYVITLRLPSRGPRRTARQRRQPRRWADEAINYLAKK